jgi:hypothetical protein
MLSTRAVADPEEEIAQANSPHDQHADGQQVEEKPISPVNAGSSSFGFGRLGG